MTGENGKREERVRTEGRITGCFKKHGSRNDNRHFDEARSQIYKSDAFLTTHEIKGWWRIESALPSVSAASRESGVFAVKSEAANFAGKLWGALKIHSNHDAAVDPWSSVVVEISTRSFVRCTPLTFRAHAQP